MVQTCDHVFPSSRDSKEFLEEKFRGLRVGLLHRAGHEDEPTVAQWPNLRGVSFVSLRIA
jgi:hypothetical protein